MSLVSVIMHSSIGTSLLVESEIGGRLAPSIRPRQERKHPARSKL